MVLYFNFIYAFFFLLVFLCSLTATAQFRDGRIGLTFGATNYITDSNSFFTKSGIGLTAGVASSVDFSERFELFVEINYNRHRVKFVGRATELAPPEDVKFNLEQISVPFLMNYNFLLLEDFKFGVNLGPSFNFIQMYSLVDSAQENYVLDPLYASPNDLRFDDRNEEISFNMFAVAGLSVQYNETIMVNLRYFYGITDPYRQIPIVSRVSEISGEDSYFSFTVTYFFE